MSKEANAELHAVASFHLWVGGTSSSNHATLKVQANPPWDTDHKLGFVTVALRDVTPRGRLSLKAPSGKEHGSDHAAC